jgi:hypothetical protein
VDGVIAEEVDRLDVAHDSTPPTRWLIRAIL